MPGAHFNEGGSTQEPCWLQKIILQLLGAERKTSALPTMPSLVHFTRQHLNDKPTS